MTTAADVTTHEGFARLWTPKDVAEYLQASRSWVYQKSESGELPSLRVCGLLRFEPEAIRAWVKGRHPRAAVVPLLPRSRTNG